MMPESHNPVLRETAHILIPLILIYALYILFHGEVAPGGGFQAGTVFSVGLILYSLIYGTEKLHRILSLRTAEILSCGGLLLYIGVGLTSFLLGKEFLNYSVLLPSMLAGQHVGIVLIELGVAVTITGTVTLIYSALADWNEAVADDRE